ncbi:MAG TPA: chemotaxis protein CheA [Caulobacteraceae bacterium]|nr:chemotaxis protein CheA [Caulobacteraceae bacterium]
MNEFLEQFLIESRELVEQATLDLLALEQTPESRDRLDSAFRAFHTLKGAAGIIEFPAMGRLLHAAEDVLSEVRAGDRTVSLDLISLCLACLDQVVQWLDEMEAAGNLPADPGPAADQLAARFKAGADDPGAQIAVAVAPDGPPPWVEALLAAYPDASAATAVRYVPDAGCFFRGEDPLGLIARAPDLQHVRLAPAAPWPPLDALDPFRSNLIIEALLGAGAGAVADHLRTVSDQIQVYPLAPPGRPDGVVSERARAILQAQIDLVLGARGEGFAGTLGSAGRVAIAVLGQAGLATSAVAHALAESLTAADPSRFADALADVLEPVASRAADEVSGPADPGGPDVVARALRVDVDRIDAIIKLVGELTVVKNALGYAARRAGEGEEGPSLAASLKDQHALLERLTAELQRSVTAIRVLPLRHVFQRFSRLVREMSVSLGKPARLAMEGDATEADKVVVEALFEPLLHVVRNALDHGVEDAAARLAAGKPETALIQLRGYREGERVIVEVSDDGRGVDPDRIREIAVARGLTSAEALTPMSDEEVIELIFAAGFSTAGAVTDLSGRGVGMDAARTAIERLGGRVTVRSRTGEGTTVRFLLPFTVMMTRIMTVEAAGQVFGVPFEAVAETLQIARADVFRVGAAEAFVLRGRTVPLVGLGATLGLAGDGDRPPTAKVVVTAVGGQLNALEVDGFGERMDVMLKPMDGLLAGMHGVAGTTVTGDGRVLIVVDVQELLD